MKIYEASRTHIDRSSLQARIIVPTGANRSTFQWKTTKGEWVIAQVEQSNKPLDPFLHSSLFTNLVLHPLTARFPGCPTYTCPKTTVSLRVMSYFYQCDIVKIVVAKRRNGEKNKPHLPFHESCTIDTIIWSTQKTHSVLRRCQAKKTWYPYLCQAQDMGDEHQLVLCQYNDSLGRKYSQTARPIFIFLQAPFTFYPITTSGRS